MTANTNTIKKELERIHERLNGTELNVEDCESLLIAISTLRHDVAWRGVKAKTDFAQAILSRSKSIADDATNGNALLARLRESSINATSAVQEKPCTVKNILNRLLDILMNAETEQDIEERQNSFNLCDRKRLNELSDRIQQLED
jgi:phosphoenolpyruvate-protein kinase (PTS system EI component)